MKKKGLGSNPLDNIIPKVNEKKEKVKSINHLKFKTLKPLKLNAYEKLLVSIRPEQLEFLERLTKKIMRDRSSEYKEKRITKNTLLRTAVEILEKVENEIDTRNIANEAILRNRINRLFEK